MAPFPNQSVHMAPFPDHSKGVTVLTHYYHCHSYRMRQVVKMLMEA